MTKVLRIYELDAIRFIAAFMVVCYHYTFRGYAADDMSPVAFPLLSIVSRYGYLGVDLFFIISGFVILMTAQSGDPIRFAISRMVRIYPAFWAGATITAIVMALYNLPPFTVTLELWLKNLPLIGGFIGVPYLDGVYWSLLVELKFYFLIFLLIIAGQIRNIFPYLCAWLAATILLHVVDAPNYIKFFLFPEWAHYFIAGAIFYLVKTQGMNWQKAVALLVCYVLSCHSAWLAIPGLVMHFGQVFYWQAIFAAIAAFYLFFLALSLSLTERINQPWLLHVGILTYPLYLVHENIGFILFHLFNGSVNKYVLLVVITVLMMVLSFAINKLVEERFGRVFRGWLFKLAGFIFPNHVHR